MEETLQNYKINLVKGNIIAEISEKALFKSVASILNQNVICFIPIDTQGVSMKFRYEDAEDEVNNNRFRNSIQSKQGLRKG